MIFSHGRAQPEIAGRRASVPVGAGAAVIKPSHDVRYQRACVKGKLTGFAGQRPDPRETSGLSALFNRK